MARATRAAKVTRVAKMARWFFPPAGAVSAGIRLVRLIPVILIAVALGLAAWRLFFYNAAARRAGAETIVAEERGDAATAAGAFATGQVITRYETHRVIDRQVEQGVRNVYSVEGGQASLVPGLDSAGRAALCLSRSYKRVNDCPGLSAADPAGASAADAVGNGSGE